MVSKKWPSVFQEHVTDNFLFVTLPQGLWDQFWHVVHLVINVQWKDHHVHESHTDSCNSMRFLYTGVFASVVAVPHIFLTATFLEWEAAVLPSATTMALTGLVLTTSKLLISVTPSFWQAVPPSAAVVLTLVALYAADFLHSVLTRWQDEDPFFLSLVAFEVELSFMSSWSLLT